MLNILAVFAGGGIGTVLRYLIGVFISHYSKTNIPIATFVVNIVGCLILGFLYVLFVEKSQMSPVLKIALTVGFCGGLTTFSTFSLEILNMIQEMQILNAVLYLFLSIIIGITAVFIGGYLCKIFIV